jgi:metal-responsive CopG/Arc/MetJ family transcriptional regulator
MYAKENPTTENKITQINNISLSQCLAAEIDRMAADDGFDNRSAFLRRLIRMEIKRRTNIIAESMKA